MLYCEGNFLNLYEKSIQRKKDKMEEATKRFPDMSFPDMVRL